VDRIDKLAFVLDVRRLKLLHALAAHGTVAAAAEAAHLTGPAVSQQLAALERETGTQLVERVGRRLRLTEAGCVLVAHAGIVLDQLAAAEADLVALGAEITGTVRTAAFSSAITTFLADTCRQLRADRAGRVQLRIASSEPEDSIRLLQRGEADLVVAYAYGVVPHPPPPSLERHDLFTDPVVLVVPRGDPLDTGGDPPAPVGLGSLSGRDWILPNPATTCHQMTERACGAAGFVPRAVAYCADFQAMLALVAAGGAIALVPRLATKSVREDVAVYPITPTTGRGIFALTRPGGDRHPAVRVVLDQLTRAAERQAAAHNNPKGDDTVRSPPSPQH